MTDSTDGSQRPASALEYVVFPASVVGLTFAIASLCFGVRAVMDIGG